MKEVYLDNAATTKPLPCVMDAMVDAMNKDFGNPSSLHRKGIDAENILKEASSFFAGALGAQKEEIFYTSGGTESNNTAILGTCYAYQRRGKRIITTAIEHASVREVFKHLESEGFEVITIGVDSKGMILEDELEKAINEETILVSIMHINNEIGSIQKIERLGNLIKGKNPKTVFHVDAIQSFGKIPIHVKKSKIDLLSISGHKFYGPKGIGILYRSKNTRVIPLLYGGGQQMNMRSGTQNIPGIAGIHAAGKYVYTHFEQVHRHYRQQKAYLTEGILTEIPHCKINGPLLEEGAPHILNVAFKDIRAEVLLHALEQKGIYVSSGSACNSNKKGINTVLKAIGCTGEDLDNAIRFSFGLETEIEDITYALEELKTQVAVLRKYKVGGKK